MAEITQDDISEARHLILDDYDEAAKDTRWRRGQSGNPAGRPPIPTDLDELLVFALGKERARMLIEAMIRRAIDDPGHVGQRAGEYILDRIKGKPRQSAPPQGEEEPLIAQLYRRLLSDSSALEGRQLARGPSTEPHSEP